MKMWLLIHALSSMLVYFNGLVQERRNSIANALELRLSCTNPLIESLVGKIGPLKADVSKMLSWLLMSCLGGNLLSTD